MRSYLSLTKVLIKNSMSSMVDGKAKTNKLMFGFAAIFIIIGLAPIPFAMYTIYDPLIKQLAALNQAGAILALTFCFSTMITFFFSLFLIPSIFYYSKDVQTLLYLPLKPETILGSKFTICILYEYVFEVFIVLPAIFAYANNGLLTPLFILFLVIIFLALPILPLAYSSLITMLIMRFIPFFKDRDKFNLLSGILGIAVALALNMTLQNLQFSDPVKLVATLVSGSNSMVSMFAYLFPTITPATLACVSGDIVQFLLFMGITVGVIAVLLMIAKAFYFKGAIGVSESKSSHRITDTKLLNKQSAKKNITYTYIQKEVRMLFRTPVYFLNCILVLIILPLVFGFTLFSGSDTSILALVDNITWTNDWYFIMILVGIALGFTFANINSISSTAISREGQGYSFMKYIPVSYAKQIHAKAYTGIIFSQLGILITLIPAILYIGVPPMYALILLVTSFCANIAGNFLGIIADILHPKLVWEQEAAAVKQNMNSFLMMMGSFAIPVLLIVILFNIDQSLWAMFSYAMFALVLILIPFLYKATGNIANKRFPKL